LSPHCGDNSTRYMLFLFSFDNKSALTQTEYHTAMNEAETRAELIDSALRAAGWGIIEGSRIRREVIAPGRLVGGQKRSKSNIADYVLVYHSEKLAVIEAKKKALPNTEGLGQAKKYAAKLQTRFTYSTNGIGIYQVDMLTGTEGYIDRYPTPNELWSATFSTVNQWRDRFAAIPFEDRSGTWEARYYQHNAIKHVLESIGQGQKRILLTMATGTGKTFVAFQLAWKLFQSRWNLSGQPTRRPRILFLADRNILANQAYNSFAAFPDDALVRIDPDEIRKKNRVPKNGSVFFTIFQTFMTKSAVGFDSAQPTAQAQPTEERWLSGVEAIAYNFIDYPPDFFDFIIIDECHRGGASDESNWRGILEYFAPAVQLGLTATPKRAHNADTYAYFGDPVYSYALKEGINDGFLTPFKVRQIETTLDEYTYELDDDLLEGAVDEARTYTESDFNRVIEIADRERYRVMANSKNFWTLC
jgi:type I restriction enzyme, R subunit